MSDSEETPVPVHGSSSRPEPPLNFKRLGREFAMQFLFQCDLTNGERTEGMEEQFWLQAEESGEFPPNRIFRKARKYAEKLIEGVLAYEPEILEDIVHLSKKWDMERMSAVDRNILKVAVYELKYCPEIPTLVSINEAIEIAKEFSSEKSGMFINGILNGLKEILPPDAKQPVQKGSVRNES